jgi:hypothetical protein
MRFEARSRMMREKHVERCWQTKCQENAVQYLCSVPSVANNLPSYAKVYVVLCCMMSSVANIAISTAVRITAVAGSDLG